MRKKGILLGIILLVGAIGLELFWQFSIQNHAKNADRLVQTIQELLPKVTNGVSEERMNLIMPSMEVDGVNFVGLLEIPAYGIDLPIYEKWDKNRVEQYSCRYIGTMYNGSLVIGGSDNKGQLDCMKIITNGDYVYVTDMTGLRYCYEVVAVEYTKDVSTENLAKDEYDLTLFARSTYGLDYILIRCKEKK